MPARRGSHRHERVRRRVHERGRPPLRMVGGARRAARRVPGLHARPLEDVAAIGDRHGLTDTGPRALVTGGAGVICSPLVDRLLLDGYTVFVVDDPFTGSAVQEPAWV